MPVAKKQVHVAVVVVVKKLYAPPTQHFRGGGDSRAGSDIVERFVLVVVVQRKRFVIHVRNEQIDPAILIIIGGVNAHSGSRKSKRIQTHSCEQANLLEAPFTVGKKKIRHCVVAHEQIHPAVIVDIGGCNAPCLGG